MTPLAYLKYGSIVAAALALFAAGWHLGALGPTAKLAAYKSSQAVLQATQESTQLKTDQKADEVHDEEISAIRLHVVDTPVLVRMPVSAPAAVQGTPAAADQPPGPRPADAGSGERDIRPGITALEARYESVIADCRRMAAEWPQ